MIPDTAALGSWIHSWIQESGAVYGFHNHSVWGCNPYTYMDFTSGHSTFGSPVLGAIAYALSEKWDERGFELLKRMIDYQASSFQENGQFEHIGFQVGESAKGGLIHNAMGQVGLLLAALYGKGYLPEDYILKITKAVDRNREALKCGGKGRAGKGGTCNQEYARIWAKLLYMDLTGTDEMEREVKEDIDLMIDLFHAPGYPDNESSGAYRAAKEKEQAKGILEPAEYYGLIIPPLLMAYRRYGEERYQEEAKRICLHVVRSSWKDGRGCRRLHRFWYIDGEKNQKCDSPMLVSGMGMTLFGIAEYLGLEENAEMKQFLEECAETYVSYQTAAGCFFPGTGWHNEMDAAPCTSWHCHDFFYLMLRYGVPENFWERFFHEDQAETILMADRCFWAEKGKYWCILNPVTEGDYAVYGRKDRKTFARDFYVWTEKPALPEELRYPGKPEFVELNDGIYRLDSGTDSTVYTVGEKPYRGRF